MLPKVPSIETSVKSLYIRTVRVPLTVFIQCYQLILRPALAYPATVLSNVKPLAVAENTNIRRV